MARQRFDIGSKWLLHRQGKGTLLVAGLKEVSHVEPMPGEIAQNRKYPDGLLRAFLRGDPEPHLVLIEVATYAERRARKQALDDLALAYSALGQLPELVMLVLRPKGQLRIGGQHEVRSKLGLSRLQAEWKPIELWTLPAEQFLAEGDIGVVPWIPLMQFDGPAEPVLERCAARIEREAPAKEREDMLVVAQVMTQLRFADPVLLSLFEGAQIMLESPLIQEWRADALHEVIIALLKDRFGATPRDVTRPLRKIIDEKKLRILSLAAAKCRDLDAFREALS
jgi:hypothetical protein